MKKKADSVQRRIKNATGLSIKPIYYCAGYKEEGGEKRKPSEGKTVPENVDLKKSLMDFYTKNIAAGTYVS